jgi:hypothetical protein
MTVATREKLAADAPAESDVITALGIAGTRAVHLTDGEHRLLQFHELHPLGYAASKGRSVRQQLRAVVWPPEGPLLGIISTEVKDVINGRHYIGALVSRLATAQEASAQLATILVPERMLHVHPVTEEDSADDWGMLLFVEIDAEVGILHRGEVGADVYAAPAEGRAPLLLPDSNLWAPDPEIIFNVATGQQ